MEMLQLRAWGSFRVDAHVKLKFVLMSALGFCGWRLLFKRVGLAHDDRRGRCAEARHDVFDPLRCGYAEPATVLAAVGTAKFTGMGPFAGADDADIAAARPLAIDGAVELHLEAD